MLPGPPLALRILWEVAPHLLPGLHGPTLGSPAWEKERKVDFPPPQLGTSVCSQRTPTDRPLHLAGAPPPRGPVQPCRRSGCAVQGWRGSLL